MKIACVKKGKGLGNLSRLQVIAKFFQLRDFQVQIFTEENISDFFDDNFDVTFIDGNFKEDDYFKFNNHSKLVIIDDGIYRKYFPDNSIIVNPNYVTEYSKYPHLKGNYTILAGPRYYPIYWHFYNQQKTVNEKVKNIYINLGATKQSIELAYSIYFLLRDNYEVNLIEPKFSFTKNEICNKLHDADIAITSCGVAMHEAVASGTPVIGTPIHEDQIQNSYYVGTFMKTLLYKKHIEQRIIDTIKSYTFKDRLIMNNSCYDIMDTYGVNRIYNKVRLLYGG